MSVCMYICKTTTTFQNNDYEHNEQEWDNWKVMENGEGKSIASSINTISANSGKSYCFVVVIFSVI